VIFLFPQSFLIWMYFAWQGLKENNLVALQELKLRWCEDLSDATLLACTTQCHALNVLVLDMCRQLTNTALASIGTCCSHLVSVSLYGCKLVEDDTVQVCMCKRMPYTWPHTFCMSIENRRRLCPFGTFDSFWLCARDRSVSPRDRYSLSIVTRVKSSLVLECHTCQYGIFGRLFHWETGRQRMSKVNRARCGTL
jgi:hypothetical protein